MYEPHRHDFDRYGRPVLLVAAPVGWLLGVVGELPAAAVAAVRALLAGGAPRTFLLAGPGKGEQDWRVRAGGWGWSAGGGGGGRCGAALRLGGDHHADDGGPVGG